MFGLKRYLRQAFISIGLYMLFVFILFVLKTTANSDSAIVICGVLASAIYLPMFAYYLYLYFLTKRKLPYVDVKRGRISSWKMFYISKTMAYLVVSDSDREYETAAVFSRYTASNFVGAEVGYAIINGKAVITEFFAEQIK